MIKITMGLGGLLCAVVAGGIGYNYVQHKRNQPAPTIFNTQNLSPKTLRLIAYFQMPPPDAQLDEEKQTAWTPMPESYKRQDNIWPYGDINSFHLPAGGNDLVQVYLISGKYEDHTLQAVAAFMAKPKYRVYKSCISFEKSDGEIVRWSEVAVVNKSYFVCSCSRDSYTWATPQPPRPTF